MGYWSEVDVMRREEQARVAGAEAIGRRWKRMVFSVRDLLRPVRGGYRIEPPLPADAQVLEVVVDPVNWTVVFVLGSQAFEPVPEDLPTPYLSYELVRDFVGRMEEARVKLEVEGLDLVKLAALRAEEEALRAELKEVRARETRDGARRCEIGERIRDIHIEADDCLFGEPTLSD
jgi:hypothetical protein